MAYDRHMNLVLGDAEEFRKLPPKKGKSEEEVRGRRARALLLARARGALDRGGGAATAPIRTARPLLAPPTTNPPPPCHLPIRIRQREERRVLGLILLRGEEIISLTIEGPPPQEDLRALKSQAAPPGTGAGRAAGRGVPVAAPGQAPAVSCAGGLGAGADPPTCTMAAAAAALPTALLCSSCDAVSLARLAKPRHTQPRTRADPTPTAHPHPRASRAPRAAWAARRPA